MTGVRGRAVASLAIAVVILPPLPDHPTARVLPSIPGFYNRSGRKSHALKAVLVMKMNSIKEYLGRPQDMVNSSLRSRF